MKKLIEYLEENHIEYTEDAIQKMEAYRGGILQWNEFINLTAIKEPGEFTVKHFVDSVVCCRENFFNEAQRVVDVGTGAGFPGVPLAILFPQKDFVLMDSLQKRLKVINNLCEEIGIRNIRTVHGRAEELAHRKEHREAYDVCVSRAVANLATLGELCLPFVKVGGTMAAYKGSEAEKEVSEAQGAMKTLGGQLSCVIDTPVGFDAQNHKLVIIKKDKPTLSKYPRKPGTPAKDPLK